jgi:hypothetical protein
MEPAMTEGIDWTAPVRPGRGMLGLNLGLPLSAVRALLGENGNIVTFPNSPKLIVDYKSEGLILLRAADSSIRNYDWQNVVARLIFEKNELVGIIALGGPTNSPYEYKGKLFDKVGLGTPVSDLLNFGPIEHDNVEEVFFSEEWKGIEIGGSDSCDISVNPTQVITFFKIYADK